MYKAAVIGDWDSIYGFSALGLDTFRVEAEDEDEKAVELLKNTQLKTYAIAERVGYQEQNYFSYVFKKTYGVSPSKYRNRQE